MINSTLFVLTLTFSDIASCLVTSLVTSVTFTFALSFLYLAHLTVFVQGFSVPHIDQFVHKE